ncbi:MULTISPECIES: hypothetical protein [Streptomyces]|uniref:Uncharacterized protein n=1 Tax=Streptomyces kasugaensis TaxID=1946 RepID=A0A4Q9HNW4_STRKA|nr:hypothetical protein [Streptomyces kasugaensis]TBO56563.1 hypothetical protein EYS09_27340 [Streptomyces kasugaensis]
MELSGGADGLLGLLPVRADDRRRTAHLVAGRAAVARRQPGPGERPGRLGEPVGQFPGPSGAGRPVRS